MKYKCRFYSLKNGCPFKSGSMRVECMLDEPDETKCVLAQESIKEMDEYKHTPLGALMRMGIKEWVSDE